MDELRKRLDELKPVVKIDELYEDGVPDIASIVVASMPIMTTAR
jgi:hypothetical protein